METTPAIELENALQKEAASGRDEFAVAVRSALGAPGTLDPSIGVAAHLFVNTDNSRQAYVLCVNGLLLVEWTGSAVFTSSVPLFRVIGMNSVDTFDENGRVLGCAILLDTGMRTTSAENGAVTEPNNMQFRVRDDLRSEAEEFISELRNSILGVWG